MRKLKAKGEINMLNLIQGEEEIALVNHTTGEINRYILRNLDEVVLVKEAQSATEEGEFELQYLSGCLVGEACDHFIELCDLARQYGEVLSVVGRLFNACDGLEETETLLESQTYTIIQAPSVGLAFRDYLNEMGDLMELPPHILDFIDYEKWLNSVSTRVIPVGFSDRQEFVVYNLI